MRTTLTLDDDVAVMLERLRRERDQSLKALVNEALRLGLRQVASPPPKAKKPFRTRTFDAGRCLVENLDNVAEVLSQIEGEEHR